MAGNLRFDQPLILLSIKLVQPGMLMDVTEGVRRLAPPSLARKVKREDVAAYIAGLREANLVCLYEGRRYMLTAAGEEYVRETGIGHQIEARRMFLLKETRQGNRVERSDSRDRSLQQ